MESELEQKHHVENQLTVLKHDFGMQNDELQKEKTLSSNLSNQVKHLEELVKIVTDEKNF